MNSEVDAAHKEDLPKVPTPSIDASGNEAPVENSEEISTKPKHLHPHSLQENDPMIDEAAQHQFDDMQKETGNPPDPVVLHGRVKPGDDKVIFVPYVDFRLYLAWLKQEYAFDQLLNEEKKLADAHAEEWEKVKSRAEDNTEQLDVKRRAAEAA